MLYHTHTSTDAHVFRATPAMQREARNRKIEQKRDEGREERGERAQGKRRNTREEKIHERIGRRENTKVHYWARVW